MFLDTGSLGLLLVDISENELLLEGGDDDVVVIAGSDFGWEKDDVSITGIGSVSDSFGLVAVSTCICYSRVLEF